jgi:hypothetical protein
MWNMELTVPIMLARQMVRIRNKIILMQMELRTLETRTIKFMQIFYKLSALVTLSTIMRMVTKI